MKGRKLTLQEVLDLEDGTKVWVEELDEEYKEWSRIYTINQEERRLYTRKGEFYRFDSYCFEEGDVEFYEWFYPTVIIKLAQEICNLRGLDLTDENIRLIVEEFMEEK